MTSGWPRAATGGCGCGRVRFSARIASDDAYLCHCGMCRRATGAVSVAYVNLPAADVAWTAAPPDLHASSPIAERGFCAHCGTSLSFRYLDSDMLDLTVGAFDDPAAFRPTSQFAIETALPAWQDTGHLPSLRLADHRPLVDRWMNAVGKLPD